MKVALKAAKICILGEELGIATKVLERAAAYEEVLGGERQDGHDEASDIPQRLIPEYYAMRTVLVRGCYFACLITY
jgi:hypothetical protein